MSRDIARVLKHHTAWLVDIAEEVRARSIRNLEKDLADGSMLAFRTIPIRLNGLAVFHGIRGTMRVADGETTGWDDISTSLDYYGWSLKIDYDNRVRSPEAISLTNQISRAACLICTSDYWYPTTRNILRTIATTSHLVDQNSWGTRTFEPFVLACCAVQDGEQPAALSPELASPYDRVFENWYDDRKLGRALHEMCDEHCRNIDDAKNNAATFKYSPFDLLPCGIILLQRVRQSVGMSLPHVDHPLLSILNSTDSIPSSGTNGDFLPRVEAAYRQFSLSND